MSVYNKISIRYISIYNTISYNINIHYQSKENKSFFFILSRVLIFLLVCLDTCKTQKVKKT